jgi:hypothetical protein
VGGHGGSGGSAGKGAGGKGAGSGGMPQEPTDPCAGDGGCSAGEGGRPTEPVTGGEGGMSTEPPIACAEGCSANHASTKCVNDACQIDTCSNGYFDCDGQYGTGCEVKQPADLGTVSAYAPMRGAYTGSLHAPDSESLRPTFRWRAVQDTGCGTIRYELQASTECRAGALADCKFEDPELSVSVATTSYRPTADLPVSETTPVGAFYAWRVRACDGARCGAYSDVMSLEVGRVKEDLNGDGYGDVALLNQNVVQIYLGSSQFDQDADGTVGEVVFAMSLSFLGDVNGDGFGDLGVTESNTSSSGSAPAVIFGAATIAEFTETVITKAAGGPSAYIFTLPAGDLNGDGFADVSVVWDYQMPLAQVRVFLGGKSLPANPNLVIDNPGVNFTYPLAHANTVGDVNADGFADLMVLVGSPSDAATTQALLFEGGKAPDNVADATVPLGNGACYMEQADVRAAGDLDDDGYGDALISCQGAFVAMYPGASSPGNALAFTIADTAAYSVASDFDIDADGIPDFVIGHSADEPSLYLGKKDLAAPLSPVTDGFAALYNGEQVAVSDHDGDGRPDLVGIELNGDVCLWLGSNGTTNPKALRIYPETSTTFNRLAR